MRSHRDIFLKLRFYAIYTPEAGAPTRWLDRVVAAGFGTVQVRDKEARVSPQILAVMAHRCRRQGVLFLINDRVDLALEIGADGVHLGAEDRPVAEVRACFRNWIIGASARTPETALAAWRDGADYLGIGPIYASTSKSNLPSPIGWDGFAHVADASPLPAVAIGGLTADRLMADPRSRRANGWAFLSAVGTPEAIDATATWVARER